MSAAIKEAGLTMRGMHVCSSGHYQTAVCGLGNCLLLDPFDEGGD